MPNASNTGLLCNTFVTTSDCSCGCSSSSSSIDCGCAPPVNSFNFFVWCAGNVARCLNTIYKIRMVCVYIKEWYVYMYF